MKTTFIFTLSLVFTMLIMSACGGRTNTETPLRTKETLTPHKVRYPIPTAYEVTGLINRSGAAFVVGITNSIGNVDKYVTDAQKAFNVGVYGTDLAYVSTYNMGQETGNYLKTLRKLTDELNISTNFSTDLVNQIEENINNKDSVIHLITQSFHDTYDFLVANGKDDLSLFVLAGTWIEGMYLVTYLTTTSVKTDDMLQIVTNQKASLETLLELLQNTQYEELKAILTQLQSIRENYAGITGKLTLKDAELLLQQIENIRKSVV